MNMVTSMRRLSITLVLFCRICGAAPEPDAVPLRTLANRAFAEKPVYLGGATSLRHHRDKEADLLRAHFNYVTPANEFKQSKVHPNPETWNWAEADAWLEIAAANAQVIRIHGPISPQCSPWAKADERTAVELDRNITEYMTELCRRYNGHPRVKWMDVVNETVNSLDGTWFGPAAGSDGWENPWLAIGLETNIPPRYTRLRDGVPLYILKAFEICTREAPDIHLVLNQHGGLNPVAWDRVKQLVLYLRERGLRVDGIGWQAHINLAASPRHRSLVDTDWTTDSVNTESLGELIDWAHANDLEFHITENNIHDAKAAPYDGERYAGIIEQILRTLLERRANGTVTWNLWTLMDRPHWKQEKLMMYGLWDENGNPQPSFYAVRDLLRSPPPPVPNRFSRPETRSGQP